MMIVWMPMMTVWYAAAAAAAGWASGGGSHYRGYRVVGPAEQTLVCMPPTTLYITYHTAIAILYIHLTHDTVLLSVLLTTLLLHCPISVYQVYLLQYYHCNTIQASILVFSFSSHKFKVESTPMIGLKSFRQFQGYLFTILKHFLLDRKKRLQRYATCTLTFFLPV